MITIKRRLAITYKHSLKMLLYRNFSTTPRVCIMSPIFYVNATPHIGHLYTGVLCDAIARYYPLY